MTLYRWRVLAMTPLSPAKDIAGRIRREVGSSGCEKGAADDSKSEAEMVDVADTLKRAISERMRVIRVPSLRRRPSCSFVRPRVSAAVCVVLTARCTLLVCHESHPC